MTATILLSLLLAASPSQAMAGMDHAPAACPAGGAAPPAGLEGWARAKPLRAGVSAARAVSLTIGEGAVATLSPTLEVTYAVRPEKPGEPASSGGVFAFTVPVAGRYRVALGAGAWIDVVGGTTPVPSVAHGHGPDCTGVGKMVDFDLKPGRYLLQVSGNGSPTLALMVARLS